MAAGFAVSNLYGNPENSAFVQPSKSSGNAWSWGGASTGDYLGAASAFTSVAGTALSQLAAQQQNKADAATYSANARIARENIVVNRNEHAINAMLLRHGARDTIASSRAAMIAAGNIGSSADAAVEQAYKNLDVSLSNMKFNYDSRDVALENQARIYEYKAEQAKKAAKKNGLSSILGTGLAVVGGVVGGVFGGPGGAALGMSLGGTVGSAAGQMIG